MTIKKLVNMGAAALILVICLGGMLAALRIDTVRIGGPIQTQMQEASDLVADVLPPPQYILEPFFEATELRNQPEDYAKGAKRLRELKQLYDERHAYWLTSSIDPVLRDALAEGSHRPAEAFWAELDQRFLPAVQARDTAAIEASYKRLSAAYAEHRTAVDKVVELALRHHGELKQTAASQLNWAIWILAGLACAILGAVVAACLVLRSKIIQPLVEVVDATTALANGANATVPHRDRGDELGRMAGAVELFRAAAETRAQADARAAVEQQQVTSTLGKSLEALQSGDLTSFVHGDFPEGYTILKDNYNGALGALRSMVQLVSESATEISASSSDIAGASEALARRTESNAASLEQTNAALVQVEALIRNSFEASLRTVSRADQARATVQSGRTIALEAVEAMGRVSGSAKGIDAVIEAMDKIAFQTRVLAMNAAVEAGRAGEAGRGFSVVADLVTALAMRAEEEAKRARDQLTVTQSEIITAVDAVKQVDGALGAISGDVAEVHALVGTMASDNQAQSQAVSEIATALTAMDHATQQNADMVEQTSVATRHLSGEVRSLAERAAAFKFERRVRDVPVAFDRRAPKKTAATAPVLSSVVPIRAEGSRSGDQRSNDGQPWRRAAAEHASGRVELR